MSTQLADVIREQIALAKVSLDADEIRVAQAKIPGCNGEILRLRAILKELESKLDSVPEIKIVFLGPSRHGKSTLLNALAQTSLLPTSDTKPCTASIVTLRFAEEWKYLLTFVSKRKLLTERDIAVNDVEDYLNRLRSESSEQVDTDDSSFVRNTLQRFIHLFKLDSSEDPFSLVHKVRVAQLPAEVEEFLGKPCIASGSFESLRQGLSKYLSTSDIYWTVLESCEIAGPFADWHPNLRLIDLPGTNDTDPHRTAVTNGLRDEAHAVAIVTSDSNIGPDIEDWLRHSSVLSDFLEATTNNRQRLFIIRTKLDSYHPEIGDAETEEEEEELRKAGFEQYQREQASTYRSMLREIVLPRLKLLNNSDTDNQKRTELLNRVSEIPVHFVSAQAYEAFQDRINVGPSQKRRFREHFADDSSATGVPKLREFVNLLAAEYLATNYYEDISIRLEREVGLLVQYFQREESTIHAQRIGAGRDIHALVVRVKEEIVPWIGTSLQVRTEQFQRAAIVGGEGIRHRLDLVGKLSVQRLRDKQDKWVNLHWNTLRATGRKSGSHTTVRGQHIDVVEDICSVLLGDVILAWTSYRDYLITDSIDQLTDQFTRELQEKLEIMASQIESTDARTAIQLIISQLDNITLSQRDELREHIGEKVRNLESIRVPAREHILRSMEPLFERIAAEAGSGCQERMRTILVNGFQERLSKIREIVNDLILNIATVLLDSCTEEITHFGGEAKGRICRTLEAVEESTLSTSEEKLHEREVILKTASETLKRNRTRSQKDYWAWHDTLYPGGDSNSPEWRELSKKVKDRDGWKCVECQADGELHADHIIPLSKGGSNDLSNLQTLCVTCHELKTKRPLRRWHRVQTS